MQILHYCARLRLIDGGVPQSILELTSALSKCGKSVTLMVTEGNDFPHADMGVQTMLTGAFDRSEIRFSTSRLAVLKQHIANADVLHLHSPWEPANIQLAKVARAVGTPYVVSVHGMLGDWVMKTSTIKKRVFLRFGGRKMFRYAAVTHCMALAEQKQTERWIPKANIKVVPPVFDPSDYLTPPPTSDPDKFWPQRESKKPVVLFFSEIHPDTGVELLIRAAAEIVKKHKVRFIIAGNGESTYEKQLIELVHKLHLQAQIEFVGEIEGDRKTALLRTADIFVLPTSHETFGLTFHQAMACGVPIVTTRGVNNWSELEASGGALIIDKDINAIRVAIETLLNNASLRKTIQVAAREWVDATFSGDTITQKYIWLYREAINQ